MRSTEGVEVFYAKVVHIRRIIPLVRKGRVLWCGSLEHKVEPYLPMGKVRETHDRLFANSDYLAQDVLRIPYLLYRSREDYIIKGISRIDLYERLQIPVMDL